MRTARYIVFAVAALAVMAVYAEICATGRPAAGETDMNHRKLTPEEARVIEGKGTEPPFTGKYWNSHEDGSYTCKRCGAVLFKSTDKFDSSCGWPSFDDAVPGAVKRVPDADGMRTEIQCASCGAHLGHVFEGERLTNKDTRYCVNSISIDLKPALKTGDAYFAGGCFWGVEYLMAKAPGVITAESGYMGGRTDSPTYGQVCSGKTGHLEAVHVVYDPSKTTYTELARLFFEIHDPTQADGQGPDLGEQYHSAVFYVSEDQRRIAQGLIETLKTKGYKVATQLRPAGKFWKAEDYHQDYYIRTGKQPYCHTRVKRL